MRSLKMKPQFESGLPAARVVEFLALQPHPEGGFFAQVFHDVPSDGSRGIGSSIYYLLEEGQKSAWHRIDVVEIWHWYAGAPLSLFVAPPESELLTYRLGSDFAGGQRPQAVVPRGAWMSATSQGKWTLVGCTTFPAFSFDGWELANEGWEP
jgi:uncharacterized protein